MPDTDIHDEEAPPPVERQLPVVVWVGEGPVRITVLDEPHREPHPGICRCGGCQATHRADLADRFLP